MRSLPNREHQTILLAGIFGVLFVWMYLAYLITPLLRHGVELSGRVRSAREELKALQDTTANEPALRNQYHRLSEAVASWRTRLPSEEELPAVIEYLTALANQSQVKIQTIFPQHPTTPTQEMGGSKKGEAGPVYRDVAIEIDALAGYHQLGTFLSLVETGTRPMQLSSLRISGEPKEPKRHRVKMIIRAYFEPVGPALGDKGAISQVSLDAPQ